MPFCLKVSLLISVCTKTKKTSRFMYEFEVSLF